MVATSPPRRAEHAGWVPSRDRADVVERLEALDAECRPELLPVRYGRMAHSPLAFFRGTPAGMAADLAGTPVSGVRVQLCGDCHLLNFGLFATSRGTIVFDIDHYDETLPGPWEWDVKRLATSAVLATRHARASEHDARTAACAALASYRHTVWRCAATSPLDVWHEQLDLRRVAEVAPNDAARRRRQRLEQRAHHWIDDHVFPRLARRVDGRYRIIDQPPFVVHDDTPGWLDRVAAFVHAYRSSMPDDTRVLLDRFEVHDAASLVAGVGPVGRECFAVLLVAANDTPLLLQFKEARPSALAGALDETARHHEGRRIVAGHRLLQSSTDPCLGWATGPGGIEYYVRHLRDMRLSLPMIDVAQPRRVATYVGFCGEVLARAHARSGDARAIADYVGHGTAFDDAVVEFAVAYADQTEQDYVALRDAVERGRIDALIDS